MLFCQSKPHLNLHCTGIAFLAFFLTSTSLLLKLPVDKGCEGREPTVYHPYSFCCLFNCLQCCYS